MRRVSGLGNVWIVGAGSVLLGAVLHLRRSPLADEVRLVRFGTFGGALAITTAPLKLLRARASFRRARGHAELGLPSGHALRTAAVYGLAAWLAARVLRTALQRWVAVGGLVVLMVGIATARVYLWVHWPSDVVVGLALGGAWLATLLRVTRPLRPVTASAVSDMAVTGATRSRQ